MVDTTHLDLLSIIGADVALKKHASASGGEYVGPCPFCGGRDRFHVWPRPAEGGPRFWCRHCGEKGDAITYVMRRDSLDFRTACERLGLALGEPRPVVRMGPPAAAERRPSPPAAEKDWPALVSDAWQERARAFVAYAQQQLWSAAGAQALAYLHGRGLTDDTLRAAGLGFNPREWRQDRATWNLELDDDKPVWLPVGVVIPWQIEGRLWRINIRRMVWNGDDLRPYSGDNKYIGPAGFANGLYNADALTRGCTVVLVEGEFDALSIGQTVPDVVAVATGSTHGSRLVSWLARLAALPGVVLVAFDTDQAGEDAAGWWLERLPDARRLRPTAHDASQMLQDGDDLRTWVTSVLPVSVAGAPALQPAAVAAPCVPEPNAIAPVDLGDGVSLYVCDNSLLTRYRAMSVVDLLAELAAGGVTVHVGAIGVLYTTGLIEPPELAMVAGDRRAEIAAHLAGAPRSALLGRADAPDGADMHALGRLDSVGAVEVAV